MPIDSSKIFDSIRIKPNKLSAKQQAQAREAAIMCEWPGCKNKGPHRAPKGRENSREYWHYCLDHVREYNQSYNFFQGMNPEDVAKYQKDALTGHRPTWKMGANSGAKGEGAFDPRARPELHLSRLPFSCAAAGTQPHHRASHRAPAAGGRGRGDQAETRRHRILTGTGLTFAGRLGVDRQRVHGTGEFAR